MQRSVGGLCHGESVSEKLMKPAPTSGHEIIGCGIAFARTPGVLYVHRQQIASLLTVLEVQRRA